MGFIKYMMSENYKSVNNLKVSEELLTFTNTELLKDLDITQEKFWNEFDKLVHDLSQKIESCLKLEKNYKNN